MLPQRAGVKPMRSLASRWPSSNSSGGLARDADRALITDAKLMILVPTLRLRTPQLVAPLDRG